MKKEQLEGNILIAINALRKIISIFLGPFLVAYFIKTSQDSTIIISFYYIISFLAHAIAGVLIGWFIKNKFKIGMFRIGVILQFIYILLIIILKEKIINYIFLIGFYYGFASICFWTPFNLFKSYKIKNINQSSYEAKNKLVSSLVTILTPIFLGSLITTTNYISTALITLIISFILIILSFCLKPVSVTNSKFQLKKTFQKLLNNSNTKNMLITTFLRGMTISDGSLGVLMTILLFNAYKSDFSLGVVNSIAALVTVVIAYFYSKYFAKRKDNYFTIICALLPICALPFILISISNLSIAFYDLCYLIVVELLSLVYEVRMFNISRTIILEHEKSEYFAIFEVVLNVGRIFSYILLLIVGLLGNIYFKYLLLLLTFIILIMGVRISKIKRFTNNYEE